MLFVLLFVVFFFYNTVLFQLSDELFIATPGFWKSRVLTYLINALLLAATFWLHLHEAICMVLYLLVLLLEYHLLYRETFIKNLFGTTCFALNFFAVRLCVKSIYSMATGVTLYSTTADVGLNLFTTLLSFGICCLYILMFRMIRTKRYLLLISTNLENMRFAATILSVLYLFQIFNSTNLYIKESYSLLALLQLKIGVASIIGFLGAIVYAFLLSRLMLFETRSNEIQRRIDTQNKEQERLKSIAYRDVFLDCYNREYGLEYLEETLLEATTSFSVAFFDLDGLKVVNDQYGHNEGDIYIKSVANILKNIFGNNLVCRMGGDEFMIVLRDTDNYMAQKYTIQVYEAVEMMAKITTKPYLMSVSYGVFEVNPKQKMTSSQILDAVDARMYEFKKSHKKARKS